MGSTPAGPPVLQLSPRVDPLPSPTRRSPIGFLAAVIAAVPAVAIVALLLGVLAYQIVSRAAGWEQGSDSDDGNGMAALLIVSLTCATIGCGGWLAIVRWIRDLMAWPGKWGLTFIAVVALSPTSFLLGLMSVEEIERFSGVPADGPLAVAGLVPGICIGLLSASVVGGTIRTGKRAMWTVLVGLPVSVWLFFLVYWSVTG